MGVTLLPVGKTNQAQACPWAMTKAPHRIPQLIRAVQEGRGGCQLVSDEASAPGPQGPNVTQSRVWEGPVAAGPWKSPAGK